MSELNKGNYVQALQLTTSLNISSADVQAHIHHLRSIVFMNMNDKNNTLSEIDKKDCFLIVSTLTLNINKAKLLSSTGALAEALKQYEIVLELKAGIETESLHNISVIHNKLNDPHAAKKYIDNVYKLEPNNQMVLTTKIKIYLNLEFFHKVITLCKGYFELFDENISIYNSMGNCL